jgi:hypothetical protein
MRHPLSVLALALLGCQATEGYPIPAERDASHGDAPTDAPSKPRPKLAVTGAQLLVTGPALGLQLTRANLAEDADVFGVHQEFYGIPWAAFEQSTPPPAEWVAVMDELAAHAQSQQKPVFLSLNVLNGTRERLAATTRIAGGAVETDDNTSGVCYDFASAPDAAAKRAAYLRYVEFMVERFDPAYVNVAIEVNLFFEKCPGARDGLVQVINAAYDAIKAKRAARVVFPSFQIDHLYGYSEDSCSDQANRDRCFDAHYATLRGIQRDRFAMSSYPFLNGIASPVDLPADWFTRAAQRGGERGLIAETGWLSTALMARSSTGDCVQVFDYSPGYSAAYLRRVLLDAVESEIDLVTWWSDRDLVVSQAMTNCPCTFDGSWCSVIDVFRGPPQAGPTDTQLFGEILLKAFGTMGLREYDGTPKQALMTLWSSARSVP